MSGQRVKRLLCFAAGFGAAFYLASLFVSGNYSLGLREKEAALAERIVERLEYLRSRPPEEVKGIYVSGPTAGEKTQREKLRKLLERTELNAMVIDLKNFEGQVTYPSEALQVTKHDLSYVVVEDMKTFVQDLRRHGIWPIARLVVFEDTVFAEARPDLAVRSKKTGSIWRDRKGLAWLDPASREVWNYNIALAQEAFAMGFGEVQLDYVRFPSDGAIEDMEFPFWNEVMPKRQVLREFFAYFRESVGDSAVLSVDLFGMTMVRTRLPNDDLGIGQRLEDAAPYFDYISPMVYPSHYPANYEGFKNPSLHPGEVVAISIEEGAPYLAGLSARAKVRPWLQDFNLGATYTASMVRSQIDASDQNGGAGWLLWNSANRYTEGALLPERE